MRRPAHAAKKESPLQRLSRRAFAFLASRQGQNGHGGQSLVLIKAFTELFCADWQQEPSEQQGESGQHDCSATVLLAVAVRQSGGHASEQPGGQLGSRQQSVGLAFVRVRDKVSPAHATPVAVSTSMVRARIVLLVIVRPPLSE
jgi:hypothetical protein